MIIFAPSADDDRYQRLLAELEQKREAIVDHNLLLVRVLDWDENWQGDDRLGVDSAAVLRHRFLVGRNHFVVVLIGADGRMKIRSDGKSSLADIISHLDPA